MTTVFEFRSEVDYFSKATFFEVDFVDSLEVQVLTILSGDADLEVSFDGTTVHKLMVPGAISEAFGWDDHPRPKVWVRRKSGSGTNGIVEIVAFRKGGKR